MSIVYIIGVIVGILVIGLIIIYNKFITLRNRKEEAWADIDVQLKRRYDLIPNLINTVKGYAAHEKETFDAVVSARNKATAINIDANDITTEQIMSLSSAETGLSGALGKLFALSESYPELEANENFLELQKELSDTENKIQAARRFYNTVIRDLNIAVESFPSNLIAKMFTFKQGDFFDLDEKPEERKNIKVGF